MITTSLLQAVAEFNAEENFYDDYKTSDNLVERQRRGLGQAIATWASWDAFAILEVMHAALSDANFHDHAKQVQTWIDEYQREAQEVL